VQRRDRPQIIGFGSGRQRARIHLAYGHEHRIRLVFGQEGTEPQSITRAPILGALNLIHERAGRRVECLGRLAQGSAGRAQVDDEGSGPSQAGRLGHRREQIVDAEMPNFTGKWSIHRCSHQRIFREVALVLAAILANHVKQNCDERLWATTKKFNSIYVNRRAIPPGRTLPTS
jgi:hypothetical protein